MVLTNRDNLHPGKLYKHGYRTLENMAYLAYM